MRLITKRANCEILGNQAAFHERVRGFDVQQFYRNICRQEIFLCHEDKWGSGDSSTFLDLRTGRE
jgi:hypothetical protein